MKKIFLIIILLGIIICSITIEGEIKTINSNHIITYNMIEKPNNLIMTDNSNIRQKDLLVALFQGLVSEDIEGEIKPALAEDYKVSEDGLGYTFNIKKNIRYSDGQEIYAEDFVGFFKEFLQDKNNIYAEQLDCVFGAKDFRQGKSDYSKVAISAIDNKTLLIRLNYQCPYFIDIIGQPIMTLREYNKLGNNIENLYSEIKYTGPFKIVSAKDNEGIVLSKNENYYDSNAVTKEKIRVLFIKDSEEALAYFDSKNDNSNNIDIMADSPINEYERLSLEEKINSYPSSTVYYLNFNIFSKGIVSDINFRNALNVSFSKEYYAQQISKDFAKAASVYVPMKEKNYKVFETYGDRDKAFAYLEKTKFTGNEALTVIYEEDGLNRRIVEDMAKNFSSDLKVNIVAKGYKKGELEEAIKNHQFDIYLEKFTPAYSDPYLYYDQWYSKSVNNKTKFSNAEYDSLFINAKYEKNQNRRVELFRQCDNILKNQLPSVPIYYINTAICIKPNLAGVYSTTTGNIKLEYLTRIADK
jgi:ABC-type oligopeptide transport system substrate-binding subunit